MLSFLILFLFISFIAWVVLGGKTKLLSSDLFWLILRWSFCFSLYFSIEKIFINRLSKQCFAYLIAAFIIYILFRFLGKAFYNQKKKSKFFKPLNNFEKNEEIHINTKTYAWISIFATLVYSVDRYISSNGVLFERSMSVSILGTIASFFMGIAFIIPIYEIGYSIKNQKKIPLEAFLCMVCWSLSSIMTSGRQELIYLAIAIVASASWALSTGKQVNFWKMFKHNRILKKIKIPFFLICGLIFGYLLYLSANRYDDFYSGNSLMFLLGADFPADVNSIAKSMGVLGYLGKNILAYFSHQVSVFQIIFDNFSGPYMNGMYQLNYIARRIGVDYTIIDTQHKAMVTVAGNPGFSSAWPTAFGTMIYDFGKIGALIEIAILAFLIGYFFQKRKVVSNSISNVLPSIACVFAFSTVMVGLTYYSTYHFAILWYFFIFFRKEKRQRG